MSNNNYNENMILNQLTQINNKINKIERNATMDIQEKTNKLTSKIVFIIILCIILFCVVVPYSILFYFMGYM